jgi:RHS repeat-associated protein
VDVTATATVATTATVSQISNALSPGKTLAQVQLTGNATWHAGSLEDTGTATLTAKASGELTMKLALSQKGQWTETQSAIGPMMSCGWSGADGVAHPLNRSSCIRSVVWFLPALSIQASGSTASLGVMDLGTDATARGSFHQVQSHVVLARRSAAVTQMFAKVSQANLDLDPLTNLPRLLKFKTYPDSGSAVVIPIEVRYSGYTLHVTNFSTVALGSAGGLNIQPPFIINNVYPFGWSGPSSGPSSTTDNNGNQITEDGNGNFTDTSGNVVLTVAGSAPNSRTFTYRDTTGTAQAVVMAYTTYQVQTNFTCNGILDYSASASLVSSITYPDGSVYQLSYEPTPGFSGSVTGRLAGVTLPTGGTIHYSYSGTNNGISCTDGSALGFTRALDQDTGTPNDASSRSYTRSVNGLTSHTELIDGNSNHLEYDFVQPQGLSGQYYETKRVAYQGAATGTPLSSQQTCYNGTSPDCTTASLMVPFTQIDSYRAANGLSMAGASTTYNTYGLQTSQSIYDFGTPTARGPLLQTETWTYGTYNAPPTSVASDVVRDGSNTAFAETDYSYATSGATSNETWPQHISFGTSFRGNLQEVIRHFNSNDGVYATFVFDDAGELTGTSTQDTQTQYTYTQSKDSAQNTTGVTVAQSQTYATGSYSLTTQTSYETANTGAGYASVDLNNQQTGVAHADPLLRPTNIYYPDGGSATYIYRSPNQVGELHAQSSSASTQTERLYDIYGRLSRTAVLKGDSWYQQDTCYDAAGLVHFVSYTYPGSGWGTARVCSGAGDTYTYDALGRVTSVTHGDTTGSQIVYSGRATKQTDENGVSRITQVDALGRTAVVCEVSSTTLSNQDAPASCGTDIAATGFLTTYAYDLANHKTTISQGVQTRVFQTDWLGRTIYTSEPERGVTTYSYAYNETGLVMTRHRPRTNQTDPNNLTTTTTQYDFMQRPLTISYDDGTPTKYFQYDTPVTWGRTTANTAGRMSQAYVPAAGNAAVTIFSYDAMGRVLFTGQCLPYGCGNGNYDKYVDESYDWVGNLRTQADPVAGTINYSYNVANQLLSATNQTWTDPTNPSTLVTNVTNGPNGATSYQLGYGLTTYNTFDPLRRHNGTWECQGAPASSICNGPSQVYGTNAGWSGQRMYTSCDTVLNALCKNFGYDDFNRLTSQTGTNANYTYTYDRYGNRLQQNSQNGGPSPQSGVDHTTNRLTGLIYDAAGNMLGDLTHSYEYDAENNLTEVDFGTTAQVDYIYDALNHRVSIHNANQTQNYIFDAMGRKVATWNSSDQALSGSEYWGASSKRIAYRIGPTIFEHTDVLGTVRMRTDYAGNVLGAYQSLAFGDGYSSTGTDSDSLHFAELESNGSTGTSHATFRDYSSTFGRWMSADPYGGSYDINNPQSLNRYSYVLNNPLSKSDALGLDETCAVEPVPGAADEVTCTDDTRDDACATDNCYDKPDDTGGDGGSEPVNKGDPYTMQAYAVLFPNSMFDTPTISTSFVYDNYPQYTLFYGSTASTQIGAADGTIVAPNKTAPCNPAVSHCGQPVQTTCSSVACHKEPFTPTPFVPPTPCLASVFVGIVALPWSGIPVWASWTLGLTSLGMTATGFGC